MAELDNAVVPEEFRSVQKFDSCLNDVSIGGPEEEKGERHKRPLVEAVPKYMRFLLPKKKIYTHQYSHVYLKRLHALRKVVEQQVQHLWGSSIPIVEKVISLSPNSPTCVVIGTLYKQQGLKPSVLDEFEDELNGKPRKETMSNFCCDEDFLVLEDESGRMDLVGLEQDLVDTLLTGLIVGMKGRLNANGHFVVEAYCFPGFAPQRNPLSRCLLQSESESTIKHQYVLLTSGLSVGDANDPLRLQLLIDYVLGHLGSDTDLVLEAEIVRVVIVGGSVKPPKIDEEVEKKKSLATGRTINKMAQPVKQLDYCIAEIATGVPVDIVSGPNDPCNITFPQQPLHPCLFPHSSRFKNTFGRLPNPFEYELGDGLVVLGHAGQPINDMLRYSRNLSALDLMEHTMRWRHIAPTAPDTLSCYPLTENDPFVLVESPHLYFVGDQEEFSTRFVKEGGVSMRLVTVPRFIETGTVVLVDLMSETLDCSTIQFDTMDLL